MPRFRVTFFDVNGTRTSFDFDAPDEVLAYNRAVSDMFNQGKTPPEEYRIINLDRNPPSDDIPIAQA